MMFKRIAIFFILSLIHCCINCSTAVNNQNTPDQKDYYELCNGLANTFTFSSKISICLPGTDYDSLKKSQCLLIEENVIKGRRGKLVISHPSLRETQIYYRNDSDDLVVNKTDYKSRIISFKYLWDYKDVAYMYRTKEQKIIGPSAAVFAAVNSNQLQYEKSEDYKGIKAYSCSTTLDKFLDFKDFKIKVIFEDPYWSHSKSENKILKLEPSNTRQSFHYIELLTNDKANSIWSMPSVGLGFIDWKDHVLPNFTGNGLHEMTLEYINDDGIETIDLYFDRNENLLRIDDIETNTVMIYNDKAKVKYTTTDGTCERTLVEKDTPQNVKRLFELMDEIENFNFFGFQYLGEEIVRGVKCNVFKQSSSMKQGQIISMKTIHVAHETDSVEDHNGFPMRFSEVNYAESNNKYTIQSKYIYNLLNYQELNYNQYYRDVFQTKHCHSDKDNLYLTILGNSSHSNDKYLNAKQNINQLKNDLNQLIRAKSNLSYLQMPEMFIEFKSFGIKIDVMFEDLVTSDYFEDFTSHWIPLIELSKPSLEASAIRCEKKALGSKKVLGYTYCEQRSECYFVENEELFTKGDKNLKGNNVFSFCPNSMVEFWNDFGDCQCAGSHDDKDVETHELPWDCVALEKNLNSFLYYSKPYVHSNDKDKKKKDDKITELTFATVATVLLSVFFVAMLASVIIVVLYQKFRSPALSASDQFFSVRYTKKSLIDGIDQ